MAELSTTNNNQEILIGCMNIHVCSEYRRNLFCGLISMINLDICIITETWIKEGNSKIMLNGIDSKKYEWVSREREKQKTDSGEGGVGILVNRELGKIEVVKVSKRFETIWIKIETKN